MPKRTLSHLLRDIVIVAVSILFAIWIIESNVLHRVLDVFGGIGILGSFFAGMFFTSAFTTLPSMALLGEFAQSYNLFAVAALGSLGALLGDLIIFRFIRDTASEDIMALTKLAGLSRIAHIFRTGLFRWLLPFLGALVIASPLPDELGLAMLGMSRVRTSLFVPISLVMNFIGIYIIGFIARSVVL